MKNIYLLSLVLLPFLALSQNKTFDFEGFQIPENSYLKDSGVDAHFNDGYILLPNQYTDAGTYDFWNGWVISNVKDTITQSFLNEAASYAGGGVDESDNYAVSYLPGKGVIKLTQEAIDKSARFYGMYISNTTYAALSMKNGDAFAKKFGGASGDDPDFFMLTISGWLDGAIKPVALDIFLADYRFEDNSEDYILKDWEWVDLTPLGEVDSLEFEFTSSDIGSFGINTPSYFCVDNIVMQMPSSNNTTATEAQLKIYPNPAIDQLCIMEIETKVIELYDIYGRRYIRKKMTSDCLDISALPKGKYILRTEKGAKAFFKL